MSQRKLNYTLNDKAAFARIAPVGLALSPIGMLFGVLAAQAGWGLPEVLLMGLFGFSGSGQFAYLGFAHPDRSQVEYLTVFLIIIGINLRYIPMSLSASASISGGTFAKGMLAHWLADESYAIERKSDGRREKTIIRLSIVFFWTLSTVCGVLLAGVLPAMAMEILRGLTFPISAILILLSLDNIFAFLRLGSASAGKKIFVTKKSFALLFCIGVSLVCILLIGPKYFWLPAIVIGYAVLTGASDG